MISSSSSPSRGADLIGAAGARIVFGDDQARLDRQNLLLLRATTALPAFPPRPTRALVSSFMRRCESLLRDLYPDEEEAAVNRIIDSCPDASQDRLRRCLTFADLLTALLAPLPLPVSDPVQAERLFEARKTLNSTMSARAYISGEQSAALDMADDLAAREPFMARCALAVAVRLSMVKSFTPLVMAPAVSFPDLFAAADRHDLFKSRVAGANLGATMSADSGADRNPKPADGRSPAKLVGERARPRNACYNCDSPDHNVWSCTTTLDLPKCKSAAAAAYARARGPAGRTAKAASAAAPRNETQSQCLFVSASFASLPKSTPPFAGLADTGADRSFVSLETAQSAGLVVSPAPPTRVTVASGVVTSSTGLVHTDISFRLRKGPPVTAHDAKLLVVPGLHPSLIIGADILGALDASVSVGRGTVSFGHSLAVTDALSGNHHASATVSLPSAPAEGPILPSFLGPAPPAVSFLAGARLHSSLGPGFAEFDSLVVGAPPPELDKQMVDLVDAAQCLLPDQRHRLLRLLRSFHPIWSRTNTAGVINYPEVVLVVDPTASLPPHPKSSGYRVPDHHAPFIRHILGEAVAMGRFREVTAEELRDAPFVSPGFGVDKSPDSRPPVRLVISYDKTLNTVLLHDSFPVDNQEDVLTALLAGLFGDTVLSKVDARNAFSQLRNSASSQRLMVFKILGRFYTSTRVELGETNAPASWSRFLASFFSLPAFSKAGASGSFNYDRYVDDMLAASLTDPSSINRHLDFLELLMARAAFHGLVLSLDKSSFFRRRGTALGVTIEGGTTSIPDETRRAIAAMRVEPTRKSVDTFLGWVGFFRTWVPGLAQLASPIREVLNSLKPGESLRPLWSTELDICVQRVKDAVASSAAAHPFNAAHRTFLFTDADDRTVSAVIGQDPTLPAGFHPAGVPLDTSKLHMIGCYSAGLRPAQRSYSASEREQLAAVFGLRRARGMLLGQAVNLVVDHEPLLAGSGAVKNLAGRRLRWLAVMAEYRLRIFHRSGQLLGGPNGLGRLADSGTLSMPLLASDLDGTPDSRTDDLACPELSFESFSLGLPAPVPAPSAPSDAASASSLHTRGLLSAAGPASSFTHDVWLSAQRDDEFLGPVLSALLASENLGPGEHWLLHDGLVHHPDGNGGTLPACPPSLLSAAVLAVHESAAGHSAAAKTTELCARLFFHPRLHKVVPDLVDTCQACQHYKHGPGGGPDSRSFHDSFSTSRPFQAISVDVLGGEFPPSKGGVTKALSITDYHTNFASVIGIEDETTAEITRALLTYFCAHGRPARVTCDGGGAFASKAFASFLTSEGVEMRPTKPNTSRANRTEKTHAGFQRVLRCHFSRPKGPHGDWLPVLQHAASVHNCLSSVVHGLSPFFLVYGFSPTLFVAGIPAAPAAAAPNLPTTPLEEALARLGARDDKMAVASLILSFTHERAAREHNLTCSYRVFQLGEKVLYHPPVLLGKWRERWRGPWSVSEVLSDDAYVLKPMVPVMDGQRASTRLVVKAARLKPYLPAVHRRFLGQPAPPIRLVDDSDGEEDPGLAGGIVPPAAPPGPVVPPPAVPPPPPLLAAVPAVPAPLLPAPGPPPSPPAAPASPAPREPPPSSPPGPALPVRVGRPVRHAPRLHVGPDADLVPHDLVDPSAYRDHFMVDIPDT